MVFTKMIGFCSVVLITALWIVRAQNGDVLACVNQLTVWCSKMRFNNGHSNFLNKKLTNSGWEVIHCVSDPGGINCTRNKSPWFSCPRDNKVRYKGSVLQKDSTNGADSEICDATRKATTMQGGFISDKKVKEAINKGKAALHQSMAKLHKDLEPLRKRCFPFCGDKSFGKTFSFQ